MDEAGAFRRRSSFDAPPTGERRGEPVQGALRNGHHTGTQSCAKPLLPAGDEYVGTTESDSNGSESLNTIDEHERITGGLRNGVHINTEPGHVVDEAHGDEPGLAVDRCGECLGDHSPVWDLDRAHLGSAYGLGAKPWVEIRRELV